MTVKLRYLALALLTCACGDHASPGLTRGRRLEAHRSSANDAPAAAAPALYADGAPARLSDSAPADLPLPGATDVLPNLVIRSGTATMQVDSLDRAIALVHGLARRVGGFIGSSTTQSGRGQVPAATLEIRMPAGRFEDAVDGLRPIGKVESVNVTAQDVGEEFVDVQARMANDQRLEARLIELVAQRTGKLSDVLAVEQELARVREEIERYEGRLRYLQSRAAVSTLTLSIHLPIPVVDEGSPGVMGEAVRDAWRNFIAVIAFLVQALGAAIPLAVVALGGWVAIRRWRRPPPTTQAA
ncbi:MAG: DUF4349 domain-containing protein [Acidobacteriota bacterium]